jgi:hypothetical protein
LRTLAVHHHHHQMPHQCALDMASTKLHCAGAPTHSSLVKLALDRFLSPQLTSIKFSLRAQCAAAMCVTHVDTNLTRSKPTQGTALNTFKEQRLR